MRRFILPVLLLSVLHLNGQYVIPVENESIEKKQKF